MKLRLVRQPGHKGFANQMYHLDGWDEVTNRPQFHSPTSGNGCLELDKCRADITFCLWGISLWWRLEVVEELSR